jgi:protein TonB
MNIPSLSSCSIAAALTVSALAPLSAAAQNAKPILQVAPAYSLQLRESGVEGEVVVGFTISANGDVLNPVVVSSTDRALNKATLVAVRQWKFTPSMKDGVAVSVRAVQPIAFRIPELHSDFTARIVVSDSKPGSQVKGSTSAN